MIRTILKNLLLIVALLIGSQLNAQNSDKFVRTDVVHLKTGSIFRGQIEFYEHGKELRLRLDENRVVSFKAREIRKIVQIANESENVTETKPKKNYDFREEGLYFHSSIGYIGGNNLFGQYTDAFNVHAQGGYQFNRLVGAGLGVGVDFYNVNIGSILPVYATTRGYLKKSNFSPYYQLAAGYGFPINSNNANDSFDSKGGYYLAPELGFRFGGSAEANFTMGLGLIWQEAVYTTTFVDGFGKNVDKYTFRRFNFKIGVLF